MFRIYCIFNGSGDIWSRRFRVLHGAPKLSSLRQVLQWSETEQMTSWRQVLHGASKLSNDILKASFTVARNWAMTSWRQVLHGVPKLSNDILRQVLHCGLKLSNDILMASFTWRAETEQWHPEGKFYSGPKLSNDILNFYLGNVQNGREFWMSSLLLISLVYYVVPKFTTRGLCIWK